MAYRLAGKELPQIGQRRFRCDAGKQKFPYLIQALAELADGTFIHGIAGYRVG